MSVAGVSGNGQSALADVLCGTLSPTAGHINLRGQALRAWPSWMVEQGVARIPEDRHAVGVIGDLPLWENAVAERLRSRAFSRLSWIRRKVARQHADKVISHFDIRGGGATTAARTLSGGNMQKLILGRVLLPPPGADEKSVPNLIVAHQPTWGLDIGAVAYVHDQLIAARDAGAAILLISDDLDEILELGDRIAVMHDGSLTEARAYDEWTREDIGLAMAGLHPAGRSGAGAGGWKNATRRRVGP